MPAGPATRPEGEAGEQPLFTPAFIILTLAELAYFLAVGMMYSAVPLFAAGPLGADEFGVGIAVGAFFVTALVLRPFAGRMSDRRGRRPLLLGGSLAFAALMLAHLFATDLTVLIALRLLLGVAEAFFFVAGVAALADLAPPGREGKALSYNSLALYLGIAFGPLIGELLIDLGGFHAAWVGAAALTMVTVVLVLLLPETRPARPEGADGAPPPLFHRHAMGPGLALFTGVASTAGFLSVAALFGREIGLEGARFVLLVYGGSVVITRVLFSGLPDRARPMRLITTALGSAAVGLLLMAAVPEPVALLAGAALAGLGVALLTPAIFAFVFGRVPASERGAATGTTSFFIDLGLGGGPILIGFVAAAAGYPAGLLAMAAIAAAGAVGTAITARAGLWQSQRR